MRLREANVSERTVSDILWHEHRTMTGHYSVAQIQEAKLLLTAHIASSKAEVRRITLHRLHAAGAEREGARR